MVRAALGRLRERYATRGRELGEARLSLQEALQSGEEGLTERSEENATLALEVRPAACRDSPDPTPAAGVMAYFYLLRTPRARWRCVPQPGALQATEKHTGDGLQGFRLQHYNVTLAAAKAGVSPGQMHIPASGLS